MIGERERNQVARMKINGPRAHVAAITIDSRPPHRLNMIRIVANCCEMAKVVEWKRKVGQQVSSDWSSSLQVPARLPRPQTHPRQRKTIRQSGAKSDEKVTAAAGTSFTRKRAHPGRSADGVRARQNNLISALDARWQMIGRARN